MINTGIYLIALIRKYKLRLIIGSVFFALACQLFQLIALVIRFGDFPNYFITYDWISNVLHVFLSTPSVKDSLNIVKKEWLFEIGFMNYDYGNGISQWSLNVIPIKVLVLTVLGFLLGLFYLVLKDKKCPVGTKRPSSFVNKLTIGGMSIGAVLVSMTTAAMSWVVCCATPSWVVGLAMLGLGVSTSLALEDKGALIFYCGMTMLFVSVFLTAHNQVNQFASEKERTSRRLPLTEVQS